MNDRVLITYDGYIAHVEMIREDKINALDAAMIKSLNDAIQELEGHKELRAIVLSGRGRGFCAGLDLANFTAMADGGSASVQKRALLPRTYGLANDFQNLCFGWQKLPIPVIGAAHNVCLGGGMHIFLGADIRYAAPETKFSIMEIRWGLIPDMGSTPVLPSLARRDVLKELIFTGRIFKTDEAQELGFVTKIADDPLKAAFETAALIATKNPDAVRANKAILNQAAYMSEADILLMESRIQENIIGSENQIEAVMAELENRAANFK